MNLPLNTSLDVSNSTLHARYNMIEQQIRPWNVFDERVLELLFSVRREQFMPLCYEALAFNDMEVPLTSPAEEAMRLGQHTLAPRVQARMLQDLHVRPTDRVLEIGTGSGYMAALLAHCANRVLTLEIVPELATFADNNLHRAGIHNVEVRCADGAQPIAEDPFDVIVLSGSVAEVPPSLLALLRNGGRLGCIAGHQPMMRATFVRRAGTHFKTTQPWDVLTSRLHHFPEPTAFCF